MQHRHRLAKLKHDLEERQIPDEVKTKSPSKNAAERRALVEQKIQEAMDEGAFDNLPGAGKPLNLNENPFAEPGQTWAFGLLKRNGMAPEWIERDKDIRQLIEQARHKLQQTKAQYGLGSPMWNVAVVNFENAVVKINRKIDDFNLIAPVVSCQRSRLVVERELARVRV